MRIGIMADVHSNNYALEALFEKEKNIDVWVCAGDIVGLFPNINETIELIKQHQVFSIAGDHECHLLNKQIMLHSFSGNDSIQKQGQAVSTENEAFLKGLNTKFSKEMDGKKICVVHALAYTNPDFSDAEKYSYNWAELEKAYNDFDVVFFGHNHLPSMYYGRNVIFINPGSLGFPIGKWAKPSYCIFNTTDNTCVFGHVDFNKNCLINDIKHLNYNQGYVQYLEKNYIW